MIKRAAVGVALLGAVLASQSTTAGQSRGVFTLALTASAASLADIVIVSLHCHEGGANRSAR